MRRTPASAATFALIAPLASWTPALGQSLDYTAYEQLFGEPVTIGATGKPVREGEAPIAIRIITREDIASYPATDLPGLLKQVVGVDVAQRTFGQSDVAIRGFNEPYSRRILVLVNGRQVYVDTFSFTDWSAIPVTLEEIKQIEVVSGPNGALYGFNAASGVINIVTLDPRFDKLNFATVQAGSQDYRRVSGGFTVPVGENGGWRLTADANRSDEFDQGFAVLPTLTGQELERHRIAFNTDLSLDFGNSWYGRFEGSYTSTEELEVQPLFLFNASDREVGSFKAEVGKETDSGFITGTAYHNFLDEPSFDNEVTVAKLGYLFKHNQNNTFRLSAEFRRNEITQKGGGAINPEFALSYDVYSASAMWDWQVMPSVSLVNAVRLDHLALQADATPTGTNPFSANDYDRTLNEVSINSSVVWQVTEVDDLRATFARGVQLPSLTDFGLSFGAGSAILFLGGDPTIDPSPITSYEVGYRRDEALIDGSLEANVFYITIKDVISPPSFIPDRTTPAPAFLFQNRGDTRAIGAEFVAEGRLNANWRWRANYALISIADDLDIKDKRFIATDFESAQPLHTANLMVAYSDESFEVSVLGHFESSTRELNFGTGQFVSDDIDAYFDIDARAAYHLTPDVVVAIAGTNLLSDSRETTATGEVERRFWLSLQTEF